ncbi:MAG TPA: ParM/StbA family protein [Anaerolineaceae bacterium]|nr:ParM/StbA family protein [Anaerolineaceae bacterium]
MVTKLGVDFGMSSSKIVGEKGEVMFFNQVAIPLGGKVEGSFTGMKARRRPMVMSGAFGEFYVGKNAHDFGQEVESFDFDTLTGTNEMRALFYGALTAFQKQFGRFEGGLELAVMLPLQLITGERAKKNQDAVKGWLVGSHEWTADGEAYAVTVDKIALAPQAIGALFDYVFDMAGQAIAGHEDAMKLECAEISVGSNSVELMVTKRNSDTEKFNGGKAVGVRKLFKRIDPRGLYTYGELDMKLRGKDDEFSDEIKAALPGHVDSWAEEVKGYINKQWEGAHERFHKIFLVGGGVHLIEKHLRQRFNGRTVVPENPLMSIARGGYKILLVNGK